MVSLLLTLRMSLRDRAALQLEIMALRHQLHVVNRSRPRVRLTHADRMLWVWLSKRWNEWRAAVVIVRPQTVLAWHVEASGFLDLEEPTSSGSTDHPVGRPPIDSQDGGGQSALGCTENSR
jgi:hypothetical protein